MAHPSSILDTVSQRFFFVPRAQIEQLYWGNSTFYEVCRDYVACIQMFHRYADDPATQESDRYAHDYAALIEALEEEILQMLTNHINENDIPTLG